MQKRIAVGALLATAVGLFVWTVFWRDTRPELARAVDATTGYTLSVSKPVQVSAALASAGHYGCTVAADPMNPQRLFAASMHTVKPSGPVLPNWQSMGIVGYYSHDGGASWHIGLERAGDRPRENLCDEAVAFGPDGALYLAYMRIVGEDEGVGLKSSRTESLYSNDGGETWQQRDTIEGLVDRPQIVVDCTASSYQDRVYCNANNNRPLFYVSSDSAKSFAAGELPDPDFKTPYPSNPVVLADGTVVIAYKESGVNVAAPPTIPVWRSTDGGVTFTPAANIPTAWRHDRARSNNGLWAIFPLLAADPGSDNFSGWLYCVWTDGHSSDERYVLFSASEDQGTTWTAPVVLSEQPLQADAAADWQAEIPAIAVNKDGIIAVSWYDRRGLSKATKRPNGEIVRTGYNVRMRASTDGGKTWMPSIQLNEEPGKGDLSEVRYWVGLTASADGRFHPIWISDATGTQQLWTATVEVMAPE